MLKKKKAFASFAFYSDYQSWVFMALDINWVTYSNRKFCCSVGLSVCRSVGPGFATLGTSR